MGAGDTDGERLDALRRRLYAPDATDADRAAFAAAESAAAAQPEATGAPVLEAGPVPAEPIPVRARPTRLRIAAIGGAAALVVATAAAVALGHPFAIRPVTATATPSPSTSVIGSIAVSAAARAAFLQALAAGRDPGLLDYLHAHPAALLGTIGSVHSADGARFVGSGPTTVRLAPTSGAARAGHVTLVLVTDRSVHFEWMATTLADANDRSGPEAPVAIDDGAAVAGEPVSGTVAYSGGVPSRLTLLLPSGVRWGAVVLDTD